MSRRIIIVEDISDDSGPIEAALEALQDQGLKAYLVSSVFASNLPLDEIPEPVAISAPSPSPGDSPSLEEIIEQKNQLEDEVRRYRTLIENSGDMMYAIDHGGNIIFISNNVSGLLGYKPEELTGRNFLDLIPPDLHSATVERFSQQFANTARGPFITEVLSKSGQRIAVEINGRNYFENNLPVLNIGLVRDIRARQAMEAELNNTVLELRQTNANLEEATRHKSEFLANMSHELRTPLNAIIGFSELLHDQTFGPLNEKQSRYVHNILNSGKHLLALVNDVLDLAKVEAGKMDLQLDSFALAEVAADVFTNVAALADKKQIDLANKVGYASLLGKTRITADRGRLRQILYNLLSNAIKFTPNGGKVELNGQVKTHQKVHWIELEVVDTGIGIKKEDQERIFEEFQMVDSTLSKRQQGTGLGLALSRQLARLHGGDIRVESEFGKGSAFTLAMPLKPLKPAITDNQSETGPVIPKHQHQAAEEEKTALVIEDEDHAAELLQLYMEQNGYRVVQCRSGEEALQRAHEIRPSVITLDIILPRKNGWDVLRELKADPATRDIPVLIVSMMDNYDTSFTLGAVACFVKPVRKEELTAKLKEIQLNELQSRRRKHFEEHRETGEPLHALVIDDNPQDRELIGMVLQGAGLKVMTASSGEEGWILASQTPPDLVVLDLLMPGLDGFGVLRRLRQNALTMDIPVFVYTAKDLDAGERSQLGQAELVLQKGDFSSVRLLEAVINLQAKND